MRARLPIALLVGVALAGPTHAAAAVISGADGDVWNAADPAPTYTIAATRGLQVEWRLEGASGGWTRTRSPVVVTLDRIADGQHVLVARNRWGGDDDDDDEGGGAARRRFSVDTLAPLIEIREPWAGAGLRARAGRRGSVLLRRCRDLRRTGARRPTRADRSRRARELRRARRRRGRQRVHRGRGLRRRPVRLPRLPRPRPLLRRPSSSGAPRPRPPGPRRASSATTNVCRRRPAAG